MATVTTTAKQKTFFGKILADIGSFFMKLVTGARNAFNNLSPQQQDAIISGVNISQIIKDGYAKGATFIVNEIATTLKIAPDVAEQVALTALKDVGINVTTVQAGLDKLAENVQAGITDTNWNSLWSTIATSAAQYLSTGSLNWVSLSMGLIEFAFQHFIKSKAA